MLFALRLALWASSQVTFLKCFSSRRSVRSHLYLTRPAVAVQTKTVVVTLVIHAAGLLRRAAAPT